MPWCGPPAFRVLAEDHDAPHSPQCAVFVSASDRAGGPLLEERRRLATGSDAGGRQRWSGIGGGADPPWGGDGREAPSRRLPRRGGGATVCTTGGFVTVWPRSVGPRFGPVRGGGLRRCTRSVPALYGNLEGGLDVGLGDGEIDGEDED